MRIRAALFAALAVSALAPGAVRAQTTLGPLLAIHDEGDFGIGAALGLPLDNVGEGIGLLADFVFFFPEVGDYWEINGNGTYSFPLENSSVLPFVLAGLNIGHASVGTFSNTDLGLNIGGGIEFDAGSVRPTAGLRATLRDGSGFIVFITLPFEIGGN
jgi:hypothetical protein